MSLWQQTYSRFATPSLLGGPPHDLDILNNSSLNFARPESPLTSHTAQTAVARRELREQPRLKIDTNVINISSSQQTHRWQYNNNTDDIVRNNNHNNHSKISEAPLGNTVSSNAKTGIAIRGISKIITDAVTTPPNCEPKAWWPQQQSLEHRLHHHHHHQQQQQDNLSRAHNRRHKIRHPLSDKYNSERSKPGVHAVRFEIDMQSNSPANEPTQSTANNTDAMDVDGSTVVNAEHIESSVTFSWTESEETDSNQQAQEPTLRANNTPFIRRVSATEQTSELSFAYFSAPANTNPLLSVTTQPPTDSDKDALNEKPITGSLAGAFNGNANDTTDKNTSRNVNSNSPSNLTNNLANVTPSLSPCSSTSSLSSTTGALTPATAITMEKSQDTYAKSSYQGSAFSSSPSSQSSSFLAVSYLPDFDSNPFTAKPTSTASLSSSPSSLHSQCTVRPKAKSICVENPYNRRRLSHHAYSCPVVTRESYSSLPWSPAASFLATIADATVKSPLPDDEGEQVREYILGRVIGRGGFSTVREAFDGKDTLAVKIIKNNPENADNDRIQMLLERETTIWRALDHSNIVKMVDVEETDYATFVFAEYCPGGTLLSHIKSSGKNGGGLSESAAREIFIQLASSIRYLHNDMRLVHKDIKLDNILLGRDGTWKLCDFGLTEFQNTDANGYSDVVDNSVAGGSLAYCPPEQLRSKNSIRNPKQDIWSLGVVLYAMLTGQLPFNDDFEPRLQFKIINGRYDEGLLDDAGVSEDCKDLLRKMFKPKPEQRIDIGEVLRSSWCQQ